VVEGAKFTGEKFKDAGKAAEPPAKSTWDNVKDGTSSFGSTVKNFFTGLFSN
jgi:TMP repeat.